MVGQISSEVLGVDSSEDQRRSLGTSLIGEEEGEGMIIDKSLGNEVIKNSGDIVNSDSGPGKSHDSVNLGGEEVDTELGHLSESNLLAFESGEVEDILVEDSAYLS